MTTFEVYWLTRLDNISDLLAIALGICAVAAFFGPIMIHAYADTETDTKAEENRVKAMAVPFAKRAFIAFLAVAALRVFIPSTKELVAIYGISYLTQNKDAREIPAAALKVLNKELQELAGDNKDKE